MADILKEELKELLLVEPIEDSPTFSSKINRLPSPKQLFGKILIKVIKKMKGTKKKRHSFRLKILICSSSFYYVITLFVLLSKITALVHC